MKILILSDCYKTSISIFSSEQAMAALMQPFGQCAELLNTKVVNSILGPGMEIAVKYVQKLNDDDLKDKVYINHYLKLMGFICCSGREMQLQFQILLPFNHTDCNRNRDRD